MRATFLLGVLAATLCAADTASDLLALERKTMDGWQKGDPGPALAVLDPAVTFYHAVTEKRLEGIGAVKALYEGFRGMPLFDAYEIRDPKVQEAGACAVLTYEFVRIRNSVSTRWNATQVYQNRGGAWRVIHSHWSEVKPQ